jgi:glutamine synthetase
MSGSSARLNAIATVASSIEPGYVENGDVTKIFGSNVFSDSVMRERLPKAVYKSIKKTIEFGDKLDSTAADAVATAMKDWAVEKGASHYAHIFFPLTGYTAEKHDSFIEPSGDGVINEFSGKTLIQGEPDGSSFPNGGIRQTHQARGYTAWDVTSPAYLQESNNGVTLCIPTIFVSWTGEALDKKIPLLRSNKVVGDQAARLLKLFGHTDIAPVASYVGPEQEYFLVDLNFYYARPDLIATDRTIFGAAPAKGQQFDDHYFGPIPERVSDYMMDVENELYKLGIPAKTRHNEVAPGQFEIAPVYEAANVGSDHQQLTMTVFKNIAKRHGFACLFHEKPFAGLNGSGKHVNWSIANKTQGNLLDPGHNPSENAQFLTFCAAVIRSIHVNGGLYRAIIASASNDHRLGANEAPPAIMSTFIGDELLEVFEAIKSGSTDGPEGKGFLNVGVDTLPHLEKDAGDRNRTSPFAFTGNRFEFRAVGSISSISGPLVVLNTCLADSIDFIATALEAKVAAGTEFNKAVAEILKEVYTEHGAAVFNGDGYSSEWHEKAVSGRGLKNLKTTPEALPELISEQTVAMFEKYSILTKQELHSRFEVYTEQYIEKVLVEIKTGLRIASTMVLPAAIRYQTDLAQNAASLKELEIAGDFSTLETVSTLTKALQEKIADLSAKVAQEGDSTYSCNTLLPGLVSLRETVDALEVVVADDEWPLPSYQEMLFIK